MSTEKVLCCFKNLDVDSNGPKILARNLNKQFSTTSFDIIATHDASNGHCELECTRDEADFIKCHLGDLVTSDHRSIWFTYKSKPTDEFSEKNKFFSAKTRTKRSWTALYNFGAMRSYDTFVSHIHDNRCPVRITVDRDTHGRPKTIVLERQHSGYRMIFDFHIVHTDILVKYGQENKHESIQIVLMLKGLPQIKQRSADGHFVRMCDQSKHNMAIDIISQCSDLWLQFDSRADACEFLRQFPTYNNLQQFIINYVDFQNISSVNSKNMSSSITSFSSELGAYAMTMLLSLGYLFTDKYLIDTAFEEEFISDHQKSPEKFYELCCVLWKNLQENHCYSLRRIFLEQNIIGRVYPNNKHRIPHVIVTPLRTLFQPMHVSIGHRAIRLYNGANGYQWMLVYIRDEDGLSEIFSMNKNDELRVRYKEILQNGLSLASPRDKKLTFCYFGSSGSQAKKQEYWFTAPVNVDSVNAPSKINEIRRALGDLKKIGNVATYIARVGLYLTTSKPTDIDLKFVSKLNWLWSQLLVPFQQWIKLPVNQTQAKAYFIEDIKRNGYCFTDGVGQISLGLAKKVAISIGIRIIKDEDIPSAFQVRVAGCKGMLSIDPQSTMNDYYIKVRKSMLKFDSDDWTLEVVDHSRLMCLSLNNQIIRLLYDLNKNNRAVFESLQNRCISQDQWHPPENKYLNIFDTQDVDRINDENRRRGYLNAKDFLRRNKIPLPVDEARCLFGIADETKLLKEGQCFIQYQRMDRKSYEVVKGEVLVTKNPCLYPGDIRRLQAVDVPALRLFIRDCIVFPVQGSRPHSNEIAGSDLDGDQYWVYWGKELTINDMMSPLAYTPAPKKTVPNVTPELIVNHILDTMDDQKSGIISNTHSVIADNEVDGTKSATCKYLAELFPRAIDSVKTGEEIDMGKVNKLRAIWCDTYPSWMVKEDKPKFESNSINGYLFNKAQDLHIHGRVYKFTLVKYDKINKDFTINIHTNDDENERQLYGNKKILYLYKLATGLFRLCYVSGGLFKVLFPCKHWYSKLTLFLFVCMFVYILHFLIT